LEGANITQDTARLAIEGIDARFVRAFLQMPLAQKFIAVNTLGVAVQGINLRDVRRIPVARPPAAEATEVSNRLEAASQRVDDESLSLDKLKLLKAGLMDDLLTGRVRVTPLLAGNQHPGSA
jgi:type I restriction enzyme S subunit